MATASVGPEVPVHTVVAKVASRCNLDCDYCYEYHSGDESWRHKPAVMQLDIASLLGRRIFEHATAHELKSFEVSLHGGEPLLAGAEHLKHIAEAIRHPAKGKVEINFGIQTNAMLLTEATIRELETFDCRVGVSLDGIQPVNDKHRVDHRGRGSFDRVVRGLQTLIECQRKRTFTGILAVINLEADAIETFRFLASFQPPLIDFLLPHGNWDRPPPGKGQPGHETPYADWLIPLFQTWFGGEHSDISIRTFEEIIEHQLGGAGMLETLGLEPVTLLTIATDGSIEAVDTLKSTYPGAQALGLHIDLNSFDEALAHQFIQLRQIGLAGLCEACVKCPIVNVCGGGYLPHRWSSLTGFRNRSVFCADLFGLIRHIERAVRDSASVQSARQSR